MNRRLVIVSVALLGLVSAIAGFFAFSQDEAPSTNSPTRILFEQPFKNAAEEPRRFEHLRRPGTRSQFLGNLVCAVYSRNA